MAETQCLLTPPERKIVISQVAETCQFRRWVLYATDCRSNHAHIVVGATDTNPKKIRKDIKAWCTRRLKEQSDPIRSNWWAERGSTRYVWDEDSLATVIQYVTEAQNHNPNA
jgi:REP element-mobilizing transposase RayT